MTDPSTSGDGHQAYEPGAPPPGPGASGAQGPGPGWPGPVGPEAQGHRAYGPGAGGWSPGGPAPVPPPGSESWPPRGPVPPALSEPPVRTAYALIAVMAVMVLSGLVRLLLELLMAGRPLETWTGLLADPGGRATFGAVVAPLALGSLALWVAALVLSIIVIVHARRGSRLWIGGVLAIAPVLLGLLFGIDVSGDLDRFPDGVVLVARILEILGDLVVAGLRAASIVLLALGLREVRAAQRGSGPVGGR